MESGRKVGEMIDESKIYLTTEDTEEQRGAICI